VIKINVVKPGKWSSVAVIVIGLLALIMGIRSMILSYSTVEVFSQQQTEVNHDSQQVVNSLLRTVLD